MIDANKYIYTAFSCYSRHLLDWHLPFYHLKSHHIQFLDLFDNRQCTDVHFNICCFHIFYVLIVSNIGFFYIAKILIISDVCKYNRLINSELNLV